MEQHKAIFIGEKVRKIYYCSNGHVSKSDKWSTAPDIYPTHQSVEEVIVAEGLLDSPPILAGENVYVSPLKKKLEIKESVRSTNNEYVYYLNYYTEILEDDKTEESKLVAEKELPIKLAEYNKKLEEQKQTKGDINKKKKFKFF